jgi:hypothetical protein
MDGDSLQQMSAAFRSQVHTACQCSPPVNTVELSQDLGDRFRCRVQHLGRGGHGCQN